MYTIDTENQKQHSDQTAPSSQQSHANAEEQDKPNYFERVDIDDSPFTAIYQENAGWFTVMGDHRLTEPTKTLKEQTDQIGDINWKFLTVVIATITEKVIEATKTK